MEYYIYTLEHPITQEIRYIGYTKNLNKRYSNHLCVEKARNKKECWIKSLKTKNLKPVINVLDKASNIEEAHDLEIYWISQFKTWGFRLTNLTSGGEGLEMPCSEETKIKISKTLKDKYSTESHKNKGIKWSEERKRKKSIATKGQAPTYGMLGKSHPAKKKVDCFKNGILYKTFESCSDAANILDLNAGNISNVCLGRNKSAGGYTFKYK